MLVSDTLSEPAAEAVMEKMGSIVTIIAKVSKIAPMRFTLFIVMLLSVEDGGAPRTHIGFGEAQIGFTR